MKILVDRAVEYHEIIATYILIRLFLMSSASPKFADKLLAVVIRFNKKNLEDLLSPVIGSELYVKVRNEYNSYDNLSEKYKFI